jgi:hypothetical protein
LEWKSRNGYINQRSHSSKAIVPEGLSGRFKREGPGIDEYIVRVAYLDRDKARPGQPSKSLSRGKRTAFLGLSDDPAHRAGPWGPRERHPVA